MTHLTYGIGGLHVQFPGWETQMVGRETFTASEDSIRGANAEAGWSSEILGYRSGLVVSGFRKVGVFTHPAGLRRLVSMKRGLPLLRVAVDRHATGFDELMISTPDAHAIAGAIHAAVTR
ncbi:hypothetical protein [Agromyces aerolatus]|uniref:hypothetical protein n=1 Tax=Agromyces sp. LY-1074 TaxID=3074080 RepID=UPI00285BC99E|nr:MULTISPECIES: hypothetical protein [unclassified Agromyces]MDR5700946.1 hypothetical protein [Agromyces sp. LY-1074]MDR5707393.1 hypothetical protein [Agromyces sp. LY-1358]